MYVRVCIFVCMYMFSPTYSPDFGIVNDHLRYGTFLRTKILNIFSLLFPSSPADRHAGTLAVKAIL